MDNSDFGVKKIHFFLAVTTISLGLLPTVANSQASLGSCFKIRYKNVNSCTHPLRSAVSRERCCTGHYRRAWSPNISPTQFQGHQTEGHFPRSRNNHNETTDVWHGDSPVRRLNGPDMEDEWTDRKIQDCQPCKTSCKKVRCGEDRQCILRNGIPKCVCSPKCHIKRKSAVCGTDGRTYSSECHLLRRSCRKKKKLRISHSGPCQTCNGVKCKRNRSCVLDQHLIPRCQKCSKSCAKSSRKRPICGTDGFTYTSKCLMKIASCKAGISVKKAYKGSCRGDADCNNVKCWNGETCLTDYLTGKPQCVRCGDFRDCTSSATVICGSDRNTYYSWCALKHTSCRTRRWLSAKPLQYCKENVTMYVEEKAKKCLLISKQDKRLNMIAMKNKNLASRTFLKKLLTNATWSKSDVELEFVADDDYKQMHEKIPRNRKQLRNEAKRKKKRKRKEIKC